MKALHLARASSMLCRARQYLLQRQADSLAVQWGDARLQSGDSQRRLLLQRRDSALRLLQLLQGHGRLLLQLLQGHGRLLLQREAPCGLLEGCERVLCLEGVVVLVLQ